MKVTNWIIATNLKLVCRRQIQILRAEAAQLLKMNDQNAKAAQHPSPDLI